MTAKDQSVSSTPQPSVRPDTEAPARLYPDLIPMGPPPFQGPPGMIPNQPITPFVPFGPQPMNPNLQIPHNIPQQKPPETFTSGLGRRLLNLAGVDSNNTNSSDTARALQNATVLQQLNRGVHSVYDSLSKAYNSTIQQQLNLLQDRFKSENNTNPWRQRMSEQVPAFFKSLANRVGVAQTNLREAWDRFRSANASELEKTPQTRSTLFGSFDALMNNNPDIFGNLGRSWSSGSSDMPVIGPNGEVEPPKRDMVVQLKNFWQARVKPQVDSARNSIVRTWHELTASGAYNPVEPMITARADRNNVNAAAPSKGSNELMDDVLSNVDMDGPEYTLLEPRDNDQANQRANTVGSQMQTRLTAMQRELNHLWNGLSNSLQKFINNSMNKGSMSSGSLDTMASENREANSDPSITEISSKLQDISQVQKDADRVYDAVERQQIHQQQQQQKNSFTEKLKSFYNNIDNSFSNLWHSTSGHLDSLQNSFNSWMDNRKSSTTSTSTTSTTSTTEKPSQR